MKTLLYIDRDHTDRAPVLEYLTKKHIEHYQKRSGRVLPWTIRSAGLRAYSGQQINPELVRALSSFGHHLIEYTPIEFSSQMLQSLDLILCPSKPIYRRFERSGVRTELVSEFANGVNRELRSPSHYVISREEGFFKTVLKKMQGKVSETDNHKLHEFYVQYARELGGYAHDITNRLIDIEGFPEKL